MADNAAGVNRQIGRKIKLTKDQRERLFQHFLPISKDGKRLKGAISESAQKFNDSLKTLSRAGSMRRKTKVEYLPFI